MPSSCYYATYAHPILNKLKLAHRAAHDSASESRTGMRSEGQEGTRGDDLIVRSSQVRPLFILLSFLFSSFFVLVHVVQHWGQYSQCQEIRRQVESVSVDR